MSIPRPNCRDSELTLVDGVATLRFCRDDVRNILAGTAIVDDIIATCCWINAEREVGALVLTGEGHAFSAGGNIKDMASKKGMFAGEPSSILNAYRHGIQNITRAVYQLEVPTITAVNGPAIGAGLDLACMCDIRLGSPKAKIAESFINLGLVPGDGGAWFLPRIVGQQRAAELSFSGRTVGAEEALSFGLFIELCENDRLIERANALARSYADKPQEAVRLTKQLLRKSSNTPLEDFLDLCASLQAKVHHGREHAEAIAAVASAISAKT